MSYNSLQSQYRDMDKRIEEVLREDTVFTKNLPFVPAAEYVNSVRYGVPQERDLVYEGDSFHIDRMEAVDRDWYTMPVNYITVPVFLSEKEIKQSRHGDIMGLLEQNEMEAAGFLAQKLEMNILHGGGAGNEGITNFTTSHAASAIESESSSDYSGSDTFEDDLETALDYLRSEQIMPPYTFVGTTGIKSFLRGDEIDAIAHSRLAEVKNTYAGDINEWHWSNNLLDGTLSTSNQRFMIFKKGTRYGYVAESVGLERAEVLGYKRWNEDVAYALRWAGTFIPKKAEAYHITTDITTA
jgi:hypothetical protein